MTPLRVFAGVLTAATAFVISRTAGAQTTVSFPVADSVTLTADVYGKGDRGVVIVGHGGYSNRGPWKVQAREIANAGFRTLVFDTRGAVALLSKGTETECLYDATCMAADVLAAVRYLRRSGAKTIAVIGGSAGGGGAAQAAVDANDGEIDRLVLLAPMSIASPERMKGRKLVAVSRDDRGGDGKPRLPGIQDQYRRSPEPKNFLLLEGAAHGQRIFASPNGVQLMREIIRFLSQK